MFQAAPALAAPVAVRYGPVVTGSGAMEVVAVGWYGQASDLLAVEGTTAMEGLAGSPDREQYVIRCAALVLDGGGDLMAATVRAYGLVTACGAAVAANRTLGGLVLRAGMAGSSLRLDPVEGARATVEFGIQCDAYTS
jgi:hypothetical protein